MAACISLARFVRNCPNCRLVSDAISNPASIFSLSKIGFSVFNVSDVSRFSAAIVSATVLPVSARCPSSSRMMTVPPLMALWVVELLLPPAATTVGRLAEKPPRDAKEEPASVLAPPATWLPLVVPRPADLSFETPPPNPKPPPTAI